MALLLLLGNFTTASNNLLCRISCCEPANARSMCNQQGCFRSGFMACTMATAMKQHQTNVCSNPCHVDVRIKPCCDCMAC